MAYSGLYVRGGEGVMILISKSKNVPPPFITNARYVVGIEQQEDETWIWARKSLAFWDETWAGGHFQLIRRILKQNILGENWDLKSC